MDETKAREEAKRDRAYDPVLRWKHIQDTITWAEANLPPELRRNRPRTHKWMATNTDSSGRGVEGAES
jgi:hypothetical protein